MTTDGNLPRDIDLLRRAFNELRELGYWARVNQDNGWAAVPEDVIKRQGKVVFWHAKETARAFDPGQANLVTSMRLHHLQRDANEISRVLKQYGLRSDVRDVRGIQTVVIEPNPQRSTAPRGASVEVDDLSGKRFKFPMTPFECTVVDHDTESDIVRLRFETLLNTLMTCPVSVIKSAL